jgi:hypothetical protein
LVRRQFKNGQWHGQGEWHGSNGEVYIGQFEQGLFNGQGSLTTHNSSYVGASRTAVAKAKARSKKAA